MDHQIDTTLAAIVSKLPQSPLLYAERNQPVDEMDSGWQFSSLETGGGDPAEAQVWTLEEVLQIEPALRSFVGMQPGTVVARSSTSVHWEII